MDETYQTFINRVAPMTLPASHKAQLENIQKSGKFDGDKPVFFPGYSIITPPCQDDLANQEFYRQFHQYQQELLAKLPSNLLIPVDPKSFHLTIADLIWDRDYESSVNSNPNFDQKLKDEIALSFQQYKETVNPEPIILQLFGLAIFPRALVALLVPKDETAYNNIFRLRRYVYQNSDLISLGIEQQSGFTGHISLGYFSDIEPDLDREQISKILSEFNEHLIDQEAPSLTVATVEFRKFDNMIHYYRQPDWPVIKF